MKGSPVRIRASALGTMRRESVVAGQLEVGRVLGEWVAFVVRIAGMRIVRRVIP